jgi:hypothetical protein
VTVICACMAVAGACSLGNDGLFGGLGRVTLLARSRTGAWVAVVSWMTRGLIRHVMVELKCNLPSPGATVQPN